MSDVYVKPRRELVYRRRTAECSRPSGCCNIQTSKIRESKAFYKHCCQLLTSYYTALDVADTTSRHWAISVCVLSGCVHISEQPITLDKQPPEYQNYYVMVTNHVHETAFRGNRCQCCLICRIINDNNIRH